MGSFNKLKNAYKKNNQDYELTQEMIEEEK